MTTEQLRYELRYYRRVAVAFAPKSAFQADVMYYALAVHPDGTVFRHSNIGVGTRGVEQTNKSLVWYCKQYEATHPIPGYGWEQFYKSIGEPACTLAKLG